MSALSQLRAFARDIKLSHTVFALPFALATTVLVHRETPVTPAQWGWILAAMVGARSSAMGFNRLVDRRIDAANPRTAQREMVAGRLAVGWAWALTLAAAALLVVAAGMLHRHALFASPLVLGVLWGYSLAKRFTAWCHVWLGVALGLSPVCAWLALTGTIGAPALVLSAVVLTWVAGFDVLYALQDRIYDQAVGLRSVPAVLGARGALLLSAALHVLTVVALVALPSVVRLGPAYWVGVAAITAILVWEHRIVGPDDHSRMNEAFFLANSLVSVVFLIAVLAAGVPGPA